MTENTPVQAPRVRRGWDIALSIVLLFITLLELIGGSFIVLLGLAFTDSCPPETCNVDRAATSVLACIIVAIAILLVGTILTIVLLVRRRRAWWVALIALVLVGAALVVGGILYALAVGYA